MRIQSILGRRHSSSHRRAYRHRFRPSLDERDRLEPRALLSLAIESRMPIPSPPTEVSVHPPILAMDMATPGRISALRSSRIPARTINQADATIYIPSGIVPGRSYPLVVAFSPTGRPQLPLSVWRTLSDRNKWVVYASKEFSDKYVNGLIRGNPELVMPAMNALVDRIDAHIETAIAHLPVDRSRIILTGLSGGGTIAHFLNLRYPGLASALIINSGQIPTDMFGPSQTPYNDPMPQSGAYANSRRLAVFLVGQGDSVTYNRMRSDPSIMSSLGWRTLMLRFPGGHQNAPVAVYQKAIRWITSQPTWR